MYFLSSFHRWGLFPSIQVCSSWLSKTQCIVRMDLILIPHWLSGVLNLLQSMRITPPTQEFDSGSWEMLTLFISEPLLRKGTKSVWRYERKGPALSRRMHLWQTKALFLLSWEGNMMVGRVRSLRAGKAGLATLPAECQSVQWSNRRKRKALILWTLSKLWK